VDAEWAATETLRVVMWPVGVGFAAEAGLQRSRSEWLRAAR